MVADRVGRVARDQRDALGRTHCPDARKCTVPLDPGELLRPLDEVVDWMFVASVVAQHADPLGAAGDDPIDDGLPELPVHHRRIGGRAAISY